MATGNSTISSRRWGEGSRLEAEWDLIARAFGLPEAVPEYRFARHVGRQFRFDRAWPGAKVAVELEGGVWSRGRHVRPKGYRVDCEKYNLATMLGWRVLRFTGDMLRKDPASCTAMVAELLGEKDDGK